MSLKNLFSRAARAPGRFTYKVLNVEEIRTHGSEAVGMAKGFWESRKGTDRCESFANAVQRRGLSHADLAALFRQHSFVAHAMLFFGTCAAGMIVLHATQGSTPGVLAGIGALLVFAGFFFRASFRAGQIERRELFAPATWARNPVLWLPAWSLSPSEVAVPYRRLTGNRSRRHD